MTQPPANSNPNLPAADQVASTTDLPQPEPGTQATGVSQPPADPQKKNKGLLVGGLLAFALVVLVLVVLFLTGVFGKSSKVSSYDDFKAAMDKAAAGSAASVCADTADTFFGSEFDEAKREAASDAGLDVAPEDIKAYLCSPIDLSSIAAAMELDNSSPMVVGFYIGDASVDENQAEDFVEASNSDDGTWLVYGENWMAVSMNGEDSFKVALLDALNGKEAARS